MTDKTDRLYTIKWQGVHTGRIGNGATGLPLDVAKKEVDRLNKMYGDAIHHWYVEWTQHEVVTG